MAEARPNIAISLYVDTIKMQNELMEKDTLNMMMMSEHSDMTEDLESQGYAVMGNKLKVIRPKELADTFMESIEEVDELLEVDRSSNSMIWDMKENQVDMYLWMYETVATDERSEILKRTKIMAKKTAGFSK